MSKRTVYGVGINDYQGKVKENRKNLKFYIVWTAMFERCYSEVCLKRHPTYQGCQVCEEWKKLSVFKEWFDEHYVEGWALDKDLLGNGSKLYSPSTAVFLPIEINSFLTSKSRFKREYPGVRRNSKNRFCSQVRMGGEKIYIGSFKTPEEASAAYRNAKKKQALVLAERYKDKLDPRAYEALINFKID